MTPVLSSRTPAASDTRRASASVAIIDVAWRYRAPWRRRAARVSVRPSCVDSRLLFAAKCAMLAMPESALQPPRSSTLRRFAISASIINIRSILINLSSAGRAARADLRRARAYRARVAPGYAPGAEPPRTARLRSSPLGVNGIAIRLAVADERRQVVVDFQHVHPGVTKPAARQGNGSINARIGFCL